MNNESSFQKYRIQRTNSDKIEVTAAAKRHNYTAAKEKIKEMRRRLPKSNGAYSSVSLPVFTLARLRRAVQKHALQHKNSALAGIMRAGSHGKVVAACLVMLLSKLKCKNSTFLMGPRGRMYNDEKYSYKKVSVYLDRELWQALQARAVQLESSLSHLADIALRLYLRQVLEKLLQKWIDRSHSWASELKKAWPLLRRSFGASWLERLLHFVSYQKIKDTERTGCPKRGQPAEFSLAYQLKFGID